MQLHPIKPHGMEGIAKRTPDPLNIKKKEKLHTQHFTKSSFLQFFAIFPHARALCEGKHPQTITFWWVNYYFLVGNYYFLVGFLCLL